MPFACGGASARIARSAQDVKMVPVIVSPTFEKVGHPSDGCSVRPQCLAPPVLRSGWGLVWVLFAGARPVSLAAAFSRGFWTMDTKRLPQMFRALTGNTPFPWQIELFDGFVSGVIPPSCVVPTGLGKTSVIPIWLVALGTQAARADVTLSRRLVYIVNRRTVVDQATNVVERIRRRLAMPITSAQSASSNALPCWFSMIFEAPRNPYRTLSVTIDSLVS